MVLKVYNTLTREKEEFKPINPDEVTIYTCGPTVYNYAHIGNLRAMLFYDLVIRYLRYKGYNVKHVMNITDVDDKTIKNSQKEGKSLKEFTEFYTKGFMEDLETLNIQIPKIMPKATEEIEGMVELIKILLDKGIAYKTENGDIYFSIAKFKDYGKLAKIDVEQLKQNAGGRLSNADEYDKEDVRDFALWKAWDKGDGDVFWETEIGKGRPGWHIECSVMSSKYLGQPFDLHMGGVDLIFPHHTNEIAQSEAAYDKKFCNYWMHNAHLIVNGEKMSKSLGNFYSLRDLLDKGYDPKSIRYELITNHYRAKLDFREDILKQTPKTLQRFYDFIDKLDEKKSEQDNPDVANIVSKAKKDFENAMDDDINISSGLAAIFDFMTAINKIMDNMSVKDAALAKETMLSFDKVLGVMKHEKAQIDSEIETLIEQREKARKTKDFALADKIRDDLKAQGIVLEDTNQGVRWKRITQ